MIEIALTKNQTAFIDDVDVEFVSSFKWYAKKGVRDKTFYVARNIPKPDGTQRTVLLHKELWKEWGLPECELDHRDRNGLNNQRTNLRQATRSQNCANRRRLCNNASGFIGVDFDRKADKFKARIRVDSKTHFLGYYVTAEDAARAYDQSARTSFGDFASLNFPEAK